MDLDLLNLHPPAGKYDKHVANGKTLRLLALAARTPLPLGLLQTLSDRLVIKHVRPAGSR